MANWETKRVTIARSDGQGNDLAVVAPDQTHRHEKSTQTGDIHFDSPRQRGAFEQAVRGLERERDAAG